MRPEPMEPCPHGGPVGVRCVDCGDPFNYELVFALRRLWQSIKERLGARHGG
jgi:hypothetical protein